MIMHAAVLDVQWGRLLVLDRETRQRVVVHTPAANRFQPGDLVRIWYNGVMTNSIPPQISAQRIELIPAVFPPTVLPPVIVPPVFFPPVVRPPFGCRGCRPSRRR